jgi:hypothetical protein
MGATHDQCLFIEMLSSEVAAYSSLEQIDGVAGTRCPVIRGRLGYTKEPPVVT